MKVNHRQHGGDGVDKSAASSSFCNFGKNSGNLAAVLPGRQ
jgi:hypothetical protein